MPAWWDRWTHMPTVEERVAYLEGRVQDQTAAFDDIRSGLRTLDTRLVSLETKLDAKIDRVFTWVVGIQVTVLLTVVGTLLALLRR